MRSLLTSICLLVWLLPSLASAATLKGVRGHKRALQDPSPPTPPEPKEDKDKKCKKYDKKKAGERRAQEEPAVKDAKAAPEPKAKGDPKEDDKAKEAKEPKEDKKAADLAREEELVCVEWESRDDEGGSSVVTDPTMTSTGGNVTSNIDFSSINVDCEAIANDEGPTDSHSVSFRVNFDVLKDADATLNNIYDAMEQELQAKVAPRIAGCSSGRFLEEGEITSKIVHVDFGELEFDHQGCDSSLASEATERGGVCMASDVPVDVYFVGDFPDNAIAKVEVAIEEHEWGVDGLLDTSEVDIVQTASSLGKEESESSGPSGGMIGGIVAAVAACCAVCGYMGYRRSRGEPLVAKAELETDEESDDDEKYKTNKVAIPQVEARAVKN